MQKRYRGWVRRVLHLYPRVWRERYLEEVLLVIQEFPVTLWTVVDFFFGALDARLHPDLLPGRLTSMTQQLRTSAIAIFCAIVVYCVAWAGMLEVKDPITSWEAATRQYPALLTAFNVVYGSGGIVFLALLAGGIPILFVTMRDGLTHRQGRVLLLCLIPILAVAGFATFAKFALDASEIRITPDDPTSPLTPLAFVLQILLVAFLFCTIAGSTVAVALAVARTEFSNRVLQFTLLPASVATAAMIVGLGATIVLGSLSFYEALQLRPIEIVFWVAMMLAAVLVAIMALRRAILAMRDHGDVLVSAA